MHRRLATIVAFLAMTCAAHTADRKPLANVAVTLPSGADEFPGGKRAEAINNTCLACHSTEMIFAQPQLSKTTWTEEVLKMRKVYGAPVDDKDIPAIVDYLDSLHP